MKNQYININLLKLLSIILFVSILIVIIIFVYKNSHYQGGSPGPSTGTSTGTSTGIPISPGPSSDPSLGKHGSPGTSPDIPISKCVGEWKDTDTCDISLNKLLQKYGEGPLCEDQETRSGQTDCPYTSNNKIDCISKWIDTDQCKDGYLLQKYTEIPERGGGKKCSPTSEIIRAGKTLCTNNQSNQPIDCVGNWTLTNICHDSNYLLQKYTISQGEKNGGKKCTEVDGELLPSSTYCKYGCSGYWKDIQGDCDNETGRVPQQFIFTKATNEYDCYYPKYRIGETKCNKINRVVDPVDCKGKWEIIPDTCDYVNNKRISQFIISNTDKNGGKKCPLPIIKSSPYGETCTDN